MPGYGGGKISNSIKIFPVLVACLLLINIGVCHAQENITTKNIINNPTTHKEAYERVNIHAAGAPAASGTPKVTVRDVTKAAPTVKNYIEKNGKIPSTIQVAGLKLKKEQFVYLMSKSIVYINNGKATATITIRNVASAPNPIGTATGTIQKTEYVQIANKVANFIEKYGRLPNYATTSFGRISPTRFTYAMVKILSFYQGNGRLPTYIKVGGIPTPASSTPTYNSNSSNSASNNGMSEYLQATRNCQVNDPSIQSLAATLTRGITNQWEKAKKIFNWVRDNISYSWYYNTRYGALGTLRYRTANCCDHAHLVVALARAAKLPARYLHGLCTFSMGTYGHVWAQIYINGKWYDADATSITNSLGVIRNWNTATGKLYGIYISLPF